MNILNSLNTFAAGSEGESKGGIESLGLDPLALLFQLGIFIVLFILIRKFALGKITQALEDRHDRIEESLKNADMIEKRVAATKEETEQIMKDARKEADAVIANAHEETGAMIKEAEMAAGKKAEKVLADGEAKLAGQIDKAKEELKKEMLGLVAQATEEVIGEKMTDSKDQDLIKKALKK